LKVLFIHIALRLPRAAASRALQASDKGHHPMNFVHRGLEKFGKAVGALTVLLLVTVLVGAPVLAIIAFSIFATVHVASIVGGGSIATSILAVAFLTAFFFFGSFYVAPHVSIGKAVDALLGNRGKDATILNMEDITDNQIEQAITLVRMIARLTSNGNPVDDAKWLAILIRDARRIIPNPVPRSLGD
jgi:hypothetical protein